MSARPFSQKIVIFKISYTMENWVLLSPILFHHLFNFLERLPKKEIMIVILAVKIFETKFTFHEVLFFSFFMFNGLVFFECASCGAR